MKRPFQQLRTGAGVMTVFLLLLAFCIAPAAAIGVSGAKYMGSIAPGGTDIHDMTVSIGAGEDPTDVVVEVKGFGQTLDAVYLPLDPSSDVSQYSARTFIHLDRTSLHLEPGSDQTVTATISLPQNVGQGGRYGIIYIHALPGKGKAFSTGVKVPIFITIAGTTPTETGSILRVDTGEVTVGQPIGITTTFKNTGDYHYYHAINWITVKDANGAVLANVSMAPLAYAIIPGNTIRFTVKPNLSSLEPGTYTVVSRVLLEDGRVLDENTTAFEVKIPYIPPVTESSITLTPGSPGTLMSPDGRYSVTFPQGSVLGEVVVTLKPYPRENLQPAPADAKLGATCFEITGLSGLLSKDATVHVAYSTDDLMAAGGDASRLRLSYRDTVQNAWVILPTQVNTQDMSLTATTNHLSVWAVMVTSSGSGVSPTGINIPLLVVIALVIVIGIVLGIRYSIARRRKWRKKKYSGLLSARAFS